MASKKFYAVKKGKTTGVFSNWADCKKSVDGYSGAVYKSFTTLEEANAYMEGLSLQMSGYRVEVSESDKIIPHDSDLPEKDCILAYVDGSYDDSLKKYAFGCVFIRDDGKIYTEYGNGDNPQSLQHRNVTGEMLGAMYAVRVALLEGAKAIEIRYDYQGIEKWVTGEWRSKTKLTQKYAEAMREWSRSISIQFTKVAAHTNVKYNELADRMAKKGLTEGQGIPKARRLEALECYQEG